MKKCVLAALFAIVVGMSSTNLFADIIIDDFNDPVFPNEQHIRVNSGAAGTTAHNGVAAGSVFGGTRDLEVTRTSASGSVIADVNRITTDFFTYAQVSTTATTD